MKLQLTKILFALIGCLLAVTLLEITLAIFPVATGNRVVAQTPDNQLLRGPAGSDSISSYGWNFRLARKFRLNNEGFPTNADFDIADTNIALIGDSYIRADQVDPDEKLAAVIAEELGGQGRRQCPGALLGLVQSTRHLDGKLATSQSHRRCGKRRRLHHGLRGVDSGAP